MNDKERLKHAKIIGNAGLIIAIIALCGLFSGNKDWFAFNLLLMAASIIMLASSNHILKEFHNKSK